MKKEGLRYFEGGKKKKKEEEEEVQEEYDEFSLTLDG